MELLFVAAKMLVADAKWTEDSQKLKTGDNTYLFIVASRPFDYINDV